MSVKAVKWSPALSLRLIDLCKTKECLRRQTKKNFSKTKREAAWKEISEVMGISTKQLKLRMLALRKRYSQEKIAIQSKHNTKSKWYAFNSLRILDEVKEVQDEWKPALSLKLIDLYKKNECLWRPSQQRDIKAKKAAAWNKISKVLNVPVKQLKSETWRLKKLYFEEKQEIQNQHKTESTWFAFDRLSFLDEMYEKAKSSWIDVEWNSLLSLKFINLYKERKCLWHPDMRKDRLKRTEAWNEISIILDIPVKQLKLKMSGMKGLYAKEKKAIHNNSKKSKWFGFDSLSFMDEDRREELESERAKSSVCLRVIKWCDSTYNTNDVEETLIKEEYPEIPVENGKEEPYLDDSSQIEQNLETENTSPKKYLNKLLSVGKRWDKESTIRFLELMSQRKSRLRSTNPDESGKAWQEMSDILGLSIKELKAKRQCCFILYRYEEKLMKRKLRIRPKWYGFNLTSNLINDDCNEMDSQKEDQLRDDCSIQNFGNEDDQSREDISIHSVDNEGDQSSQEVSTLPFVTEDVQFREEDSILPNNNAKIMNVCRSCLSDMGSLIDMSSTIVDGEITLDKVFLQLTGVEIVKGISSKICLDCKNQLEGFVKFRTRAQSSQETLIGWSNGLQSVVTIKEEHDTESIIEKESITKSIFDKYLIDNHLNPVVRIERLNYPFPTDNKQGSEKSSSIDDDNSSTEENQTKVNYIENTPSSSDCFGNPIIENETANDSTIVEKDNIGENQWDNMEWEEEISDEVESTSEQEELPPVNYPKHWYEALKRSPIIFPCANCKIVFTNSELHEKHNCFTKGLCPICGKYVQQLKEHMLYHGEERPFKCKVCEMRFKTKTTLGSHERTHQEKKLQCPDCDKKFFREFYLRLHQKYHENIRPYECTQCNKRFVRLSQKNQHIKHQHQGFRYSCTFCPKDFADSKNLKKHIRNHTKEKPYKCCECSRPFIAFDYLKNHARRLHPDKYSTICNPDNYKTENDNLQKKVN